LNVLSVVTDTAWYIPKQEGFKKSKNLKNTSEINDSHFVAAQGSIPLKHAPSDIGPPLKKVKISHAYLSPSHKKRKLEIEDSTPSKKAKFASSSRFPNGSSFIGLTWDGTNYSCAYDSFFTILYGIWIQNREHWTDRYSIISPNMTQLALGFQDVNNGLITFERLRDNIRHQLNQKDSTAFPYGFRGTSVVELAKAIFENSIENASSYHKCSSCNWEDVPINECVSILGYQAHNRPHSVNDYFKDIFKEPTRMICPECANYLTKLTEYDELPKMMAFSIGDSNVHINKKLKVRTQAEHIYFHLRGVVYLGAFHFTARLISNEHSVWFHDGQTSAQGCDYIGDLNLFHGNDLSTCDGKQAVLAIYIQG
jgi:hypothetical protein